MRIILVRHGESLWNVEDRHQGHADSGLTDRGRQQAQRVGRALADEVGALATVWSSDLPRARDTAQAYADLVGAAVVEDARLREVSVGSGSGRRIADVEQEEPEVVAASRAGGDPRRGGGETFAELRVRMIECLMEIAEQGADPALVFSHGGSIRVASAHAAGTPSPGHASMGPPSNCSRTRSEEHTSELQSRGHLVCRLLLDKK